MSSSTCPHRPGRTQTSWWPESHHISSIVNEEVADLPEAVVEGVGGAAWDAVAVDLVALDAVDARGPKK